MLLILLLLLLPLASAEKPLLEQSVADFTGSRNKTLFYKTTEGPSSATLSVPRRPNGDLVLYLHPAIGIDDLCAPSQIPAGSYFQDDGMRAQLRELLETGYTILQPDYQGLGTKGPHPFLQIKKNMPAIKGALREAFLNEPRLSGRYIALGYSQGAAMALETAHQGARFPGMLQGTVALAPPSFLPTQIEASLLLQGPNPAAALLIYMLRSSGNQDLLSPLGKKLDQEGRGMCVLEFTSLVIRSGVSTRDVIDINQRQRIKKFLSKFQNPQGPLAGPVLMISADDDRVVFPSLVELLAKNLEGNITQKTVRGDHFSITKNSWPLVRSFMKQSFRQPSSRFYVGVS